MEKYATSLIIRKCKSKPKWDTTSHLQGWLNNFFFNLKKKNHKYWWEIGTLVYCWWECKIVQLLWKTFWRFHKKINIEWSHDEAIPLLVHTKENWKHVFTQKLFFYCTYFYFSNLCSNLYFSSLMFCLWLHFFPALSRYNWHITLRKFKVYNIVI